MHIMSNYDVIEFIRPEATRKITVIKTGEKTSQSFYQSSGTSSGFEGTYFPFEGMTDKNAKGFYKIATGYQGGHAKYIKPSAPTLEELGTIYQPLIKTTGIAAKNEIWQRFKNIECMVISSVIGGGFWDTKQGFDLKNTLDKQYAHLYDKYADIHLSDTPLKTIALKDVAEVNNWTESRHEQLKDQSPQISSPQKEKQQPEAKATIQRQDAFIRTATISRENAMSSSTLSQYKKQLARTEKLVKMHEQYKKPYKKLPSGVTKRKRH